MKKKNRPILQLKNEERPIDPNLVNQIGALKALKATHDLLDIGLWEKRNIHVVNECQGFIKNIHEDALKKALTHPDAKRSAELNSYFEKEAPHAEA